MNLGLWAPFTDTAGVKQWYGGFPSEVDVALQSYSFRPEDFEPLAPSKFGQLLREAEAFANNSVRHLHLADHNPTHFEEVRRAGLAAFDLHFGANAKGKYLAVRQMYEIALYCHDCYHCGSTLRIDAPASALRQPSLGVNVSVEWVSVLEMIDFGRRHNLPWPKIAFIVAVILATTFAGAIAQKRGLSNIPIVKPTHLMSCMTRAADVYIRPTFAGFVNKGVNVNVREMPAQGRVETYDQFIDAQLGFLTGYTTEAHSRLNTAAGNNLTSKLRWTQTVKSHIGTFGQVKAGKRPDLVKLIKRELAAAGITS